MTAGALDHPPADPAPRGSGCTTAADGSCAARLADAAKTGGETGAAAEPVREAGAPAEPVREAEGAAEPVRETGAAAEPVRETGAAAEPVRETGAAAEPVRGPGAEGGGRPAGRRALAVLPLQQAPLAAAQVR
ncbi:hypothetical protein [Actinacidiphila sp. ITFR-21]|uniref:hypothetical protein n=1 Tax=Actinacidiphila sp. ITFR-21 TaxID=3075199 RepID=UPI00288AE8BE|nr:hypothetical protein [Streptomyces sp. ITFR-21]WNI15310.1 hypothetical protein RLT57_07040 [Streptomyces sp. ITFR-21]